MTTDILLDLFANSLRDAEQICGDIPDARAAEQFPGLRNNPAWTLTHLCVANEFAMNVLFGRAATCPEDWGPKARPGSIPVGDRSAYAPVATLLETLRALHKEFDRAVRAADPSLWEREAPEYLRKFSPKLGHLALYMLATHEQYHLAQVQQWRRAAGLAKD
jgi:hypothetical protein